MPRWAPFVSLVLLALAACAPPAPQPPPGRSRADLLVGDLQATLVAVNGAAGDRLGFRGAAAISGDTAVLGAPARDALSGVAYVFVRNGGAWTEDAMLVASDGAADDAFGSAVAASNDTILVGASEKEERRGAAYVFVRDGNAWIEQAKLEPDAVGLGSRFGAAVAVAGDTAVVGAPLDDEARSEAGAVYVFARTGTTWSGQGKLTVDAGHDSYRLGISVAAAADTIVAGAADAGGLSRGEARVFVRTGTAWGWQGTLAASDAADFALFGSSVAISGDTAVVGAPFAAAAAAAAGQAYVFVRVAGVWSGAARLAASDGAANDNLGVGVGVGGDTVVAGAPNAAAGRGGAWVFARVGGGWVEQSQLGPAGGAAGDAFGVSVAVSGQDVLVGADGTDAGRGAGYVFHLGRALGEGCATAGECAGNACVVGVCCAAAWCRGFACAGGQCGDFCAGDDECAPDWACDTFSATCKGPPGVECSDPGGCQGNICAGGRCCEDVCAYLDPVCGGACDGQGACAYPPATTTCPCADGGTALCWHGACQCDATDGGLADGGADGPAPEPGGGCGCRAGRGPSGASGLVLLAAVGLTALRRRAAAPRGHTRRGERTAITLVTLLIAIAGAAGTAWAQAPASAPARAGGGLGRLPAGWRVLHGQPGWQAALAGTTVVILEEGFTHLRELRVHDARGAVVARATLPFSASLTVGERLLAAAGTAGLVVLDRATLQERGRLSGWFTVAALEQALGPRRLLCERLGDEHHREPRLRQILLLEVTSRGE